jgi:predicted flavoprotein YhiN
LHSRLALTLLRALPLAANEPLPWELLGRIAELAKNLRLTVTSGPAAEQAQLSRGGFATSEFEPLTLQARDHPGLFAAGECLDVDGPCGGYNLHWAWASGLAAGQAAAQAAAQATAQAAAQAASQAAVGQAAAAP